MLRCCYGWHSRGRRSSRTRTRRPTCLRVPHKEGVTFVAGQTVDLDEYPVFRADPDKGGFA